MSKRVADATERGRVISRTWWNGCAYAQSPPGRRSLQQRVADEPDGQRARIGVVRFDRVYRSGAPG